MSVMIRSLVNYEQTFEGIILKPFALQIRDEQTSSMTTAISLRRLHVTAVILDPLNSTTSALGQQAGIVIKDPLTGLVIGQADGQGNVVPLGSSSLDDAVFTPAGALTVSDDTLRPGESQLLDRVLTFNGDTGIAFGATAGLILVAAPCALIRIRCISGGTITTLHDNASAASGALILGSTTLVAGEVLEVGELAANGLFVVVANGTYRAQAPLLAA